MLTYSDIELDINNFNESSIQKIDNAHQKSNNTALLSLRADAFWKNKEFQKSGRQKTGFSKSVCHTIGINLLKGGLAEYKGHTARAEYFILIGSYEKAEEHLAIARDYLPVTLRKQRLHNVLMSLNQCKQMLKKFKLFF